MAQAATNSSDPHSTNEFKAAAEAAYVDGYRTGEIRGRWDTGMDLSDRLARDIGDGPWNTSQLAWQKDVSTRAFVIGLGSGGHVRSPNDPVPNVPDLGNVGPAAVSNTTLDQITSDAYSQGARAGRENAHQSTTNMIYTFAYEQAASLNVSFPHVDAVLGLSPEQRPASVTSSDAKGVGPHTDPVSVARRSFAAPAAATAVQPPSATGASGSASPHRNERTSGRSR